MHVQATRPAVPASRRRQFRWSNCWPRLLASGTQLTYTRLRAGTEMLEHSDCYLHASIDGLDGRETFGPVPAKCGFALHGLKCKVQCDLLRKKEKKKTWSHWRVVATRLSDSCVSFCFLYIAVPGLWARKLFAISQVAIYNCLFRICSFFFFFLLFIYIFRFDGRTGWQQLHGCSPSVRPLAKPRRGLDIPKRKKNVRCSRTISIYLRIRYK